MGNLNYILSTFFVFEIIISIILIIIFKNISKLKKELEISKSNFETLSKEFHTNDKQLRRIVSQTNKDITLVERTLRNEIKKV